QVGTISTSGLYTAPSTVSSNVTVTVIATSVDDPSRNGTATVNLMPPLAPIRVAAGGPSYVSQSGQTWSADYGYSGGSTWGNSTPVTNTPDPTLYSNLRYGWSFYYQFSRPSGTYTVTLKFAEIYYTTTGSRLFNVSINGTQVLSNFDITAAAGGAF